MVNIGLFVRAPFWVSGLERVLGADNLALEVGGQGRMVLSEALDAQVATQVRLGYVHVLNLHVHIVHLTV